jgi:hypothetical protein
LVVKEVDLLELGPALLVRSPKRVGYAGSRREGRPGQRLVGPQAQRPRRGGQHSQHCVGLDKPRVVVQNLQAVDGHGLSSDFGLAEP